MTRWISFVLPAVVASFVTVPATDFRARVQDRAESNTSLTGRLATVEPANRRLTVVAEGDVDLSEVFVSDPATIVHDAQEISLSELVILVGRRVEVAYRLENNRRVSDRIIVEPKE